MMLSSTTILSKYTVFSEPFYEKNKYIEQQIVFSGISGQALIVHPEVVILLKNGEFTKIPEQVLDSLFDINVFTDEKNSELDSILNENNTEAKEEKILYHVVQPTAWCQLDCGYCGQTHEKKAMSDEFIQNIYNIIERKLKFKKYDHLHMGWFGGEPLAGLPVIRQMSADLMRMAKNNNISYSSKMVTNGVALTTKIYTELSSIFKCSHFEVTLDGPQEIHDKSRPMKSGKGSFKEIINNLINIGELNKEEIVSDAKITLRINVGKTNFNHVENLLDILIEKKFQWLNGVYFAPIHDWGNDAGKQSLSIEKFSQLELVWYSKLLSSGFNISLIPSRKKIACMALSHTSEVFDSYGDRFNCTELSQVKSFGLPNRFRIGNIDLIESGTSKRLFSDFNQKISNHETGCSKCFCLPVCGGACPKSWEENHVPCPSFKYNFKERLLLQYASQVR